MSVRRGTAGLRNSRKTGRPATFVLALLIGTRAYAAAPPDPLHRDSPQSSAAAFLAAAEGKHYDRAWRYLDLRSIGADQRLKAGTLLTAQLQEILNRDPQFDLAMLTPDPEGSPAGNDHERVDSFRIDGKTAEIEMERVTLHSGAKVWLFSAASVALIPQLARLASNSPIEKYLPEPLVSWKLMDTALWRWIALLLLVAILLAASTLISRLVVMWMQPAMKRLAPRVSPSLLTSLSGPLRLLLVSAGFRAGLEWVDPAARLRFWLERGAGLVFLWAVAWLAMRLTDLLMVRLRTALASQHQTFTYSVLPLASRVTKILIVTLTATALLSNWGYHTGTILAGLGVGGIALALAAQKTVENLFGGVAVITDRPVSIGDFCRFGDKSGVVEDIGLRSTRIRTLDRTLLTVPNGLFSSTALENFSNRDKMWFHLTLNLRRDTTSSQMRTLLEALDKGLKQNAKVEAGALPVRFVGIGANSFDVEIFVYVLTLDGDEFTRLQQELLLWILDEVAAAGTGLATAA